MTEELGFYKDQTDSCGMCTVNLDCSECVVDDFINQLRNILYSSSGYKGDHQ